MRVSRLKIKLGIIAVVAALSFQSARAGDFTINIPKRGVLTPVQKLNRQGVKAVRNHDYQKAETIFYKAYLYDPADPFTLNNLGYISELEGNLDRAQKFYALAAKQGCTALIDLSSAKQLDGKPMTAALNGLKDLPMRINRMNIQAIGLLQDHRNVEADKLLRRALALNPRDPFTLNNLAVADEATGDFEDALNYYDRAANLHSTESIVLSARPASRGKPISEIAAESAQNLRKRMQGLSSAQTQSAMYAFRGVAAVNRNDWPAAKKDFLQAYKLDPSNPFSLNNLGYVAEKNGDMETAQFYYSKARQALGSNARVGLASSSLAEGDPLTNVAARSDHAIGRELSQYQRNRRKQTGPIELVPRGAPSLRPASAPPSTTQPPQ